MQEQVSRHIAPREVHTDMMACSDLCSVGNSRAFVIFFQKGNEKPINATLTRLVHN